MKRGTTAGWLKQAVVAVALCGLLCGVSGVAGAADGLWPIAQGPNWSPFFGAQPTGVLNKVIGFRIRIGGWLPQTRTNAKVDDPGESRVNFSNLSVDPEDIIPAFDLHITILATHTLRVGYWSSTQEGKTTLSNAVTFNGTLFPGATAVEAEVELSVIKVGYEFMILDGEWLRLGVGLGCDIISTQEQIKQTGGVLEGKRDDQLIVPFVSGEVAVTFSGVSIFANVDAIHYGPAYLFDGRAGLSYGMDLPPAVGTFSLGGGLDWRIWDVMVDNSDLDAEWTQQGLEFFVFFRF